MPPLLGILLSVPLTELAPMLGLPALSAPNVLATWLVLLLGFVEERGFDQQAATPCASGGCWRSRNSEKELRLLVREICANLPLAS